MLQKARIITKLRDYRGIGLDVIRKVFIRYKDQSQALIGELLDDLDQYKALCQLDQDSGMIFNKKNNFVMKRVCDKLAEGVELSKVGAVDIEEDVKREYDMRDEM